MNILLADDHQIFSDGLKLVLEISPDLRVLHSVNNGRDAVDIAISNEIDVVLMDINMPKLTGLEAIKEIKKLKPEIKIIVLSMHNSFYTIKQALQVGANGYLFKSTNRDELIEAINRVMDDEIYLSADISKTVLEGIQQQESTGSELQEHELSTREREVLSLIAAGYTNPQVGEKLFISTETVNKHRKNMLIKFGVHTTAALVRLALEQQLI